MIEYDIPNSVFERKHSKAFGLFFHNWFEDSRGLIRREVDTEFLQKLMPREKELAVELLRRNLHLGYAHIIEGIASLDDKSSIRVLEEMLERTNDDSRKLTIAGTLWKLSAHKSFPEMIERMVRHGNGILKQAHFDQILWLADYRAILYLIDLLTDDDSFVSFLALARLNEIEDNKRYLLGRDEFPHQKHYYFRRREDGVFVNSMVVKLNTYDPSTFIMSTVSGLVTENINTER